MIGREIKRHAKHRFSLPLGLFLQSAPSFPPSLPSRPPPTFHLSVRVDFHLTPVSRVHVHQPPLPVALLPDLGREHDQLILADGVDPHLLIGYQGVDAPEEDPLVFLRHVHALFMFVRRPRLFETRVHVLVDLLQPATEGKPGVESINQSIHAYHLAPPRRYDGRRQSGRLKLHKNITTHTGMTSLARACPNTARTQPSSQCPLPPLPPSSAPYPRITRSSFAYICTAPSSFHRLKMLFTSRPFRSS